MKKLVKAVIKAVAAFAVVISLMGSSSTMKVYAWPIQYAYQCKHDSVRIAIEPVPWTDTKWYYQDICPYCGTVFGTHIDMAPTAFFLEMSKKIQDLQSVPPRGNTTKISLADILRSIWG